MQNKNVILFLLTFALVGCMELQPPYASGLHSFTLKTVYPEGSEVLSGAAVTIENISEGSAYRLETDARGEINTRLPNGIYRVSVHKRAGSDIFNGTVDRVIIADADMSVEVKLLYSKAGTLVIKELYCGGCPKVPEEGTYQSDQYIIVHNNDSEVAFLDGLCLGTLSPYNSNAANPWVQEGIFPEFIPIIQAVWRIGGSGESFPLQPGEDAVICLRGAIDHSAQYPMSVNLNKPGYFVCYNPIYFSNPVYHPVPGDRIEESRYLEVVIKTGQANAYTVSLNSPAMVIFRPVGIDIYDFVALPDNLIQVPGSTVDKVVAVPAEWVIDGVEVFNGGSSDNRKRLTPVVDAGYVTLSEIYKGKSLMRKTDEAASLTQGFEVLMDNNNSSEDFY
ncbi:MAG: DUF4876 domain-containing protein, partial [Bacteroidales bacterium]|nr:DUF4876 domain-containing protein [Bacteroidales bacterium]